MTIDFHNFFRTGTLQFSFNYIFFSRSYIFIWLKFLQSNKNVNFLKNNSKKHIKTSKEAL